MCHNPAILFRMEERGFLREGYHADLVLVEPNQPWNVNKQNILYKCGWSPLEGEQLRSKITHTFINSHLVYHNDQFNEKTKGQHLTFNR